MHRISMNAFTKACKFVNECNLGCNKRSRRLTDQFRRCVVGDNYRNSTHYQRMKNMLDGSDRIRRMGAQYDSVGPVEILNCAACGKEHGLRNYDRLQPSVLNLLLERGASPNWDR